MPQRQKDTVRAAIVAAAAAELAQVGFERATLAAIARRAGTSIGNLYKYFADKDALFEATVPDAFAEELRALLRQRVEALGPERDVTALPPEHRYRAAAAELARFTLRERDRVLFLLRRAEGTRHAPFADEIAAELVRLAVRYARTAYPGVALGAAERRALSRIYRAFVAAQADMIEDEGTEAALAAATEAHATYHLAGLRAFFQARARKESA